ncbi:MAG: hypothetical protein H6721_20100 [Sandaracinus sp.]|nr:hypothetical protein [Sandaracinus sp.]MCB9617189.1 hypothetical protein [Sandaracinus sp.]MCB9634431.1 hypothetical protein [Sandaracinus sp.]
MGKGVTCPSCGGSTPLPDDLRVATFDCTFCRTTLRTADFAGEGVVSAEGIARHLEGILDMSAQQAVEGAQALDPLEDRNHAMHDAACQLCGAPVKVPLALEEKVFTCGGCGKEQAIVRYVSDEDRAHLDMDRQVEENEALDRLIASGVSCGRCGGHNAVPDDGTPQVICVHCNNVILLGEHVAPGALARRRLRRAVFGLRDEAQARQDASDATGRIFAWLFLAFFVVAITLAAIFLE